VDEVGVDSASNKVRVKVNPDFYRPLDNQNLLGSAAKAKRVLGWTPTYSFEALVEEMVLCDIEAVNTGRIFSNSNLDWVVSESHNGACSENSIISNGLPKVADFPYPFGKAHSLIANDEGSSDGAEKISLTDVGP
jgi:GDPmannose 4,6-dehydratase